MRIHLKGLLEICFKRNFLSSAFLYTLFFKILNSSFCYLIFEKNFELQIL